LYQREGTLADDGQPPQSLCQALAGHGVIFQHYHKTSGMDIAGG
jgi:hypothetical protein